MKVKLLLVASMLALSACNDSPSDPSSTISQRLNATNPLATNEQQGLDEQAIRIFNAQQFEPIRSEAALVYVLARQQIPSSEALSRLDNAIDELVFSAIQKVVNGDPYRPKIYWVNAQPRHWFNTEIPGSRYSYDNPDNIYRIIPINGSLRYELRGQRIGNGPTDVTFSLINNASSQGTEAFLDGRDLVLNPDGSFVVTIDNQPANGRVNHLQSNNKVIQLFVHNNLGDWNNELPDRLSIVRTDETPSPAEITESQITQRSFLALQDAVLYYGVGALGVKTHTNRINTLPQPDQSSTLGTLVSQANSFGHFKLAEDEGLLITLERGGAGYFVVPVTDPWMVTVDPAKHQSSLNHAQSKANPDGTYTFVVSAQDPGIHNWLDTAGLLEGTIMVRWQLLPETPVGAGPRVQAQRIKLAELPSLLPSTTVYVTPAQRQQQLSLRKAGYDQRVSFPN